MNPLILVIIICEVSLAICTWLSPKALRRLAALLLTRADVIDAAREVRERRMQFWRGELGLDRELVLGEAGEALPSMNQAVRH
jgi:hypothetical protein